MAGERGGEHHQRQHRQGVHDPRDRSLAARPHVGRGPGDGAGGGQAAEQGRADIGRALRQHLGVGAMGAADHPVRDHGREQRLDRRQKGDHESRGQYFHDPVEGERRQGGQGQAVLV